MSCQDTITINKASHLAQLYADQILQIADADAGDAPQVEIDALRQRPPFRYLDRVFNPPFETDGVFGWVHLEESRDRLYDWSLHGSFLLEALAQLSSVMIRRQTGSTRGGVLSAIERATFDPHPPQRAGILLHVRLKAGESPHFSIEGTARQAGTVLCSCLLSTRINTGDQS